SNDQASGRANRRAARRCAEGADHPKPRSDGEGPGAAGAAPGGRKDHRPLPTGTGLRAVFVPDLALEEPPRAPLEEAFSVRVVGPERAREGLSVVKSFSPTPLTCMRCSTRAT